MPTKVIPQKYMYAAFVALGLTFAGEHLSSNSHQGEERWETKVLADDENDSVIYTPEKTTLHKLVGLETTKSHDGNTRQPVELKTYKIECHIDDFLYEDDGDVHLVLKFDTETMIGEIPFPYYPEAASSGNKTKFIKVRKQFHKIVDGNKNYPLKTVIVTGVGFVDFSHGQTGRAPNNLELHPILNIELKK